VRGREVYREVRAPARMVDLPAPGMSAPPFGRTRHPFFMHEMIRGQSVAAHATRRAVADALVAAPVAAPARRLLCVGLGTSFHAALATAHAARTACGGQFDAVAATSFDLLQEPRLIVPGTVAVVFSAGGNTALTLAAQHHLQEHGVPNLLITSEEGTPSAEVADRTLVTQHAKEESWTHTVSFTAALVASGTVIEQWTGGSATTLLNEDALTNAVAGALATEPQILDLVDPMSDRDRILLVGSGGAEASAREAALKLREAAGRFCAAVGIEELLHGVLPSVTPQTAVLAISGTDLERRRALEGLAAARLLGATTMLFDTSGGPSVEGVCAFASVPAPIPPPVVQVIPLQLLAYWAAVSNGRNPDVMGLDDARVMSARRSFGI
jgi:glucosamine--fructose-6-phosphate aminotransferase (isomerizing)